MLDYKAKYKELKAKMIEATDLAYRLGMADGLKQGAMQAQQQQMAQMQQAMMQPQIDPATGQPIQGGQPGQPGMDPSMGGMSGQPGAAPMDPSMMDPNAMAGGMDPNAMGSQDLEPGAANEMDQYIEELESLVAKGEKPSVIDIRKRVEAITNLRKSQKAKMKQNQPQVIAAQKKLVSGILSKWEKETKVTSENLEDVLKESGLKLE